MDGFYQKCVEGTERLYLGHFQNVLPNWKAQQGIAVDILHEQLRSPRALRQQAYRGSPQTRPRANVSPPARVVRHATICKTPAVLEARAARWHLHGDVKELRRERKPRCHGVLDGMEQGDNHSTVDPQEVLARHVEEG